ncbi:MAG TPA: hypothetical protein VF202_11275 [Trueperaceae bacterium]
MRVWRIYDHEVIVNPAHERAASLRALHSDVIGLDGRLLRSLGTKDLSGSQ